MQNSLRAQALAYLKTARAGWGRPEKFNTESLYQLVALAIEGLWIAWLDQHGGAPDHHAFRDLIRAAERVEPLPPDLKARLLGLDRYQTLCVWIPVEPVKPTRDEIPGLIDLGDEVARYTA